MIIILAAILTICAIYGVNKISNQWMQNMHI